MSIIIYKYMYYNIVIGVLRYLGWTKCFLLGTPLSTERVQIVEKATTALCKKLKIGAKRQSERFTAFSVLDAASALDDDHLEDACREVTPKPLWSQLRNSSSFYS